MVTSLSNPFLLDIIKKKEADSSRGSRRLELAVTIDAAKVLWSTYVLGDAVLSLETYDPFQKVHVATELLTSIASI